MDILIPFVLATMIIVLVDSVRKRNRIVRVAKAMSYLSALHYIHSTESNENANAMTTDLWSDKKHPAASRLRLKHYNLARRAIKDGVAESIVEAAKKEGWYGN